MTSDGATQMPTDLQPILLTAREAAQALACGERTLWSLTSPRGPIPVVKLGRLVRYRPSDLAAFVERRLEHSTSTEDGHT